MPRHKGKVEKGVDYIKSNALKGRTFTSVKGGVKSRRMAL